MTCLSGNLLLNYLSLSSAFVLGDKMKYCASITNNMQVYCEIRCEIEFVNYYIWHVFSLPSHFLYNYFRIAKIFTKYFTNAKVTSY